MTRKLITFLGTGCYDPCTYHLHGVVAEPTKYIQEAILDIHEKMEKPIDEFHILLTSQAKEKNWLGEEALLKRLEKYYGEYLRIVEHEISFEQNMDNLWKLFETIVNIMEKDDEIVFDITHSFRFQPMLALLSLHFARVTKGISVSAIYYGVYDSSADVKEFPVLDLTPFVDMQDWVTNVYAFSRTGRVEGLTSWIQEKDREIRKEERRTTMDLQLVQNLANSWYDLMSALQTNRSMAIPEKAEQAIEHIEAIKDAGVELRPVFLPLNDVLTDVEEKVKPMTADDPVQSGIAAIEWCYQHGLFQQAYTMADELMITVICEKFQLDKKDLDTRFLANNSLNKAINIVQKKNKEISNFDQRIVEDLLKFPLLVKIMDLIKDNRNDINHAGWRANPLDAATLEKHFHKNFSDYKKLLLEYYHS